MGKGLQKESFNTRIGTILDTSLTLDLKRVDICFEHNVKSILDSRKLLCFLHFRELSKIKEITNRISSYFYSHLWSGNGTFYL